MESWVESDVPSPEVDEKRGDSSAHKDIGRWRGWCSIGRAAQRMSSHLKSLFTVSSGSVLAFVWSLSPQRRYSPFPTPCSEAFWHASVHHARVLPFLGRPENPLSSGSSISFFPLFLFTLLVVPIDLPYPRTRNSKIYFNNFPTITLSDFRRRRVTNYKQTINSDKYDSRNRSDGNSYTRDRVLC